MINFRPRRKARQVILQALYSYLLINNSPQDVLDFAKIDNQNLQYDRGYFERVYLYVIKQKPNLEAIFAKYSERKTQELDPIEHCILLMATAELFYELEIPYKVILNEALDLARKFGANESYKLINSVLHQVAQELRNIEVKSLVG